MNTMKTILIIIICLASQTNLTSQIDTIALQTPEGITNKMLELISGPVGEDRNWDAYRNLFLPTAQKISISKSAGAKTRVRVMNLEEFVRNVGPLYSRDGFEEYTIGLEVEEWNGIANVFQSYYCKNLIGTYEKRGINSYQLVYKDNRWWIASTMFTSETEEVILPDSLLFEEYQKESK